MVINGGEYLEWPPTEPEEMHRLKRRIDAMLTELFDKEFDEAMWEWTMEQEPAYTLTDTPRLVAIVKDLDDGLAMEYGWRSFPEHLEKGTYDAMYFKRP